MGSQKIMLEKGQDPLKMEFADPRPNPLMGCLLGFGLLLCGGSCVASTLWAMGVFK